MRLTRNSALLFSAALAQFLSIPVLAQQSCCSSCNGAPSCGIDSVQPSSPLTDYGASSPDVAPQINYQPQSLALSDTTFAAFDSAAGYIDPAMIQTQIRFRYDTAYSFNRPDRAEYFYTTWASLGGQNPNPNDNPPGFPEPDMDMQVLTVYYEHALTDNLSVFANLPYVMSNPLRNPNDSAFGDLQAGFKLSLYHDQCQQLTFQLKNYMQLVDANQFWTSTGHFSIEPGILYYRNLGGRWSLESEVRDWIPINGAVNPNNGEDYAGNVLRYGLGLGYDLGSIRCYNVKPIVELVGWSVLDGQKFVFDDDAIDRSNQNLTAGDVGPTDADGDTIVNLKLGTRITNCCGGSFYGGWGHSLTSSRWYRDIFRIEYRRTF